MNPKIERINKAFPILAEHPEMVQSIVDLREAFNLDGVPFEIGIGKKKIGSLTNYFKLLDARECSCDICRLNREKPTKPRKTWRPYG